MLVAHAPVVVQAIAQQTDASAARGRLERGVESVLQAAEVIESEEVGLTPFSSMEGLKVRLVID